MTHRLLQPLFRLGIVVFLTGGLVIVVGQALGVVLGDARWVAEVQSGAQPSTCVAASVCGILSFVLSYGRPEENPADAAGRAPEQAVATHPSE
ncbi:hypothetical protein C3486_28865 [Streptomyces sp. Ru73]|uniref:hypothetical protein n=1 Tax=Streptomyces sp. Ru73 TaxID=2080748 RepID=UPI000CDD746B|nr:hypothetical protein [Streptomyces sp. Ru73]POX37320.1 hypothetical protein C3486_28865 [Streptomyces sp. Ru73]